MIYCIHNIGYKRINMEYLSDVEYKFSACYFIGLLHYSLWLIFVNNHTVSIILSEDD